MSSAYWAAPRAFFVLPPEVKVQVAALYPGNPFCQLGPRR
jgi:hypothetical protein